MYRYYSPNEPTSATPVSITAGKGFRRDMKEVKAFVETIPPQVRPDIRSWFEKHYDEFCHAIRPIWIARQDGELVGLLMARMDDQNDAKLSVLFVRDVPRRLEISSDLLEKFERVGREGEFKAAHLHINVNEVEVRQFFNDHGWQFIKFEPPEKQVILMVKRPLSFLRR
jgi:hypothetical protein